LRRDDGARKNARRQQHEDFVMTWKRIRRALKADDRSWKNIDQTPIPVSADRIWLADRDGNVRRALAWTWGILNRREPRRYRWWMLRANHASAPTVEAVAALKALRRARN
jgi:hypothetical protein